ALLAGYRFEVRLVVVENLFPKRRVERLPRPILVPRGKIAQLEILDAELGRELVGACLEQRRRGGLAGKAPVRAERQRHERVPEEKASNLRERQHCNDL